MKSDILPEFQKFLRSRHIVQKHYIPFYACWASKFLAFSKNDPNLSHDLKVQKFFNYLNTQKNIADWQIKQA